LIRSRLYFSRLFEESQTESATPAITPSSSSSLPFFSVFKSTAKEVGELGALALAQRDKKIFLEKKKLELGFRAPNKIFTPLKMLVGMRQKKDQREKKREDREKESGLRPRAGSKIKKRTAQDTGKGREIGEAQVGSLAPGKSGDALRVKSFTAQKLNTQRRQMSMAKRMRR